MKSKMGIFNLFRTSLVFEGDVNVGHLTHAPIHLFTSNSNLRSHFLREVFDLPEYVVTPLSQPL